MALFVGLGTAYYLGWEKLEPRLVDLVQGFKGRFSLSEMALNMIDEYPIFGSGPGSFEAVAQFELSETFTTWQSWIHNDYLEFYLTFGKLGCAVLIALSFIFTLQFFAKFLEWSVRPLEWFSFLAFVGVSIHAIMDFPLQVYSILALLTLIMTVILTLNPRHRRMPT
jgi:hypothetical protein